MEETTSTGRANKSEQVDEGEIMIDHDSGGESMKEGIGVGKCLKNSSP